jgi:hypothetical protein
VKLAKNLRVGDRVLGNEGVLRVVRAGPAYFQGGSVFIEWDDGSFSCLRPRDSVAILAPSVTMESSVSSVPGPIVGALLGWWRRRQWTT